MDIALAAVVAAALLALPLFLWRATRTAARSERRTVLVVPGARSATLTLDVVCDEPANPSLRRLVRESAARLFAETPDLEEIEFSSRDGVRLGKVRRSPPIPRPVAMAEIPGRRRSGGADDFERALEHDPPPSDPLPRWLRAERAESADAARARVLTSFFDLPEPVAARVTNPSDPVDLVRAILEAGGASVTVRDDLVLADGSAVIVVRSHVGHPVSSEQLSHAYLTFRASGAARGIVVSLGFANPADLRRREILVPALTHVGPNGVQRMADAVALGADPLRFAARPRLLAG